MSEQSIDEVHFVDYQNRTFDYDSSGIERRRRRHYLWTIGL